MKKKKIRGHRRRWKDIENWRLNNSGLNLIEERTYAKIWVHPWNGITLTNSLIPEPTRKTKHKIINGLLDIYDNWKKQLDQLGQPYYLKIWLFEPRFSKSQIVCAIGNNSDFHDNTFSSTPETNKSLNVDSYGQLKNRLQNYNWDCRLDEDYYFNNEVLPPERYATIQDYEEEKIWFEKLLKKKHRVYKFPEPMGEVTESYVFERGNVWLGEKK